MLRALLYAYVLGGVTFIPLLFFLVVFTTVYTSVPVGDPHVTKQSLNDQETEKEVVADSEATTAEPANDLPRTRKGWLTVRRTFHESVSDGSYVTLVRSFLDSRSKDPKRSRPKDMWYVVLKGTVLYLYEDEEMSECEAVIELSQHQVVISPEKLPDAELFAKRNSICLSPKFSKHSRIPSLSRKMHLQPENIPDSKEDLAENERNAAREEAMNPMTPWFIFVRSNVDMEDWYLALIHASEHPAQTPTLSPLHDIFDPLDMNQLVSTLDEQPDVIPMRWLNALLGRIFFSHYRTQALEAYIIGRLTKKLSKVKIPAFLTEVAVTDVSVGKRAPMFSKPMLKELTKEGDASIEVHLHYRGEIRITVEATAVINLGARFKSYTVKLVLAAVLKELEGNLLVKVKRPPSNRIWYAFTQTPQMVMEVEPIVSDRQITWGMILGTIESKFKEIIQESVVMPNMDDIAFFDTEPYERRGGIWSDAARKSPCPSFTSHDEGPHHLFSMDTPATPSESTQKFDDASIQSAPAATSALEVPSSSTNLDDSPDPSNPTRRISSTVNEEDATSMPNLIWSDQPEERNFTEEPGIPITSHPEFSSQPKESPATDDTLERTSHQGLSTAPSMSSRRSVSHYSIEVPQNPGDQEKARKPSPVPRKSSDASASIRSSSPPSFFNTLKARTADKQAIKETAKEAIRKWGVNWGGFRKDVNAIDLGQSHDISESNTNQSGIPQVDGEANAPTQKSRASYAEVRAAVAERKEREKASQLLNHGSEPLNEISPSPETTRLRTQDTSRSPDASSTTFETSQAVPLPSPSGVITKKSSLSRMNVEPTMQHQARISEEPVKPIPIHVQPVAKTMAIPGIHASHRGEVQSIGYVAPQLQPPALSGHVSETVLKNPAIQTVYRFLKSNGDRKQESPDLPVHNPSHQIINPSWPLSVVPPTESFDDQPCPSEIPLSPPGIPLKRTPPPLPPRSTSASQLQTSWPLSGSSGLNTTQDEYVQVDDSNPTIRFTSQEPAPDETPSQIGSEYSALSQTDRGKSGATSEALVGNGAPPPLPPRPTVPKVANDP